MKIQKKLTIAVVMLFGLFIIVLALQTIIARRNFLDLLRESKKQKESVFDTIVTLKGTPLETLAYDYSFWDEMVDFIEKKDAGWGAQNLDVSLDTFKANAIWAYNTDRMLVYSVNNLEDPGLKEIPLPQAAISKLFEKARFCHFFLSTSNALMEVRGATIHPGSDLERKTPPKGYFLVGKVWDKNYFDELQSLTASRIEVKAIASKEIPGVLSPQKNAITFLRILNDWEGKPLAHLNVISGESEEAIIFNKTSKQIFLLVLIFAGVFLLSISAMIIKWISMPLQSVSMALKKNDDASIKTLKQYQNEFSDIARLIQEFIQQKEELLKEIARRKKTTEELERSEERFQNIADNSGDWIWEVDVQGRYTYSSPMIERVLGYTPQEILGTYFYDLFLPEEQTRMKEAAFAVFSGKKPFQGFLNRNVHKDGHVVILETSGIPVVSPDGVLLGYRGVDRDITERKKAEEELKDAYEQLRNTQAQLIQSSKMAAIGQLAGGVAHEINNPLTGVLNNVQLIRMEAELKKEFTLGDFKQLLAVIEESALRCKKITQSLLDFSHVSKGKFYPLNLNSLVDNVVNVIRTEIKLANISLHTVLQQDVADVLGDSQLLQQVIIGLVSNAKWAIDKKPGNAGGTITIQTHQEPGSKSVILSVEDSGIGISEENLSKLFEPFFSTKEIGEGTGLGLALIDNIIHTHNGKITVESQVNVGTTFTISFPCIG
jgi:PAS domain S-box-containing protein